MERFRINHQKEETPQHLPIAELMCEAAEKFEKK